MLLAMTALAVDGWSAAAGDLHREIFGFEFGFEYDK